MSWNNALPYWLYEMQYEQFLAEASCCFYDEWTSGFSRKLPQNYVTTLVERRKEPEVKQRYFKSLYVP